MHDMASIGATAAASQSGKVWNKLWALVGNV
jgi:hypothetical protein